jgi:hypothetical protein
MIRKIKLKPDRGRLLDRKPGRGNGKKNVMVIGIRSRTKTKENKRGDLATVSGTGRIFMNRYRTAISVG